jgi:hypothetical protein
MKHLLLAPFEDEVIEEEGYCEGSGLKARRMGSKYVRGKLRYRCSVCGGHYAKDKDGNLHRHGYKLGIAAEKPGDMSTCARCSKRFAGLDYLCGKCRKKS